MIFKDLIPKEKGRGNSFFLLQERKICVSEGSFHSETETVLKSVHWRLHVYYRARESKSLCCPELNSSRMKHSRFQDCDHVPLLTASKGSLSRSGKLEGPCISDYVTQGMFNQSCS